MSSEDMLVLSTSALILRRGIGNTQEEIIDPAGDIKFFKLSSDSRFLAWARSQSVEIMELNDRSVRHTFEAPRVQCLGFSPNGSYLWLWSSPEKFHRDSLNENFQIYKISKCNGELKMDLIHSIQLSNYNNSELFWIDDKSCFQIVSKTIKFFTDGQLDYQKEIPGLVSASFSTKFACTFVEPADTNYPGFIKLFQLPDISSSALASYPMRDKKDFAYFWNNRGNRVVVTCLDKTDGSLSYYGNNHVYFLGFKGEAFKMDFGDKETAYDITWFPKSDKLAIIHGGFPTTVTLYNNVGDPINKITTGKFNRVIINPFESLMCISGIGSIKGHTEFWSIEKNKPICRVETPIANDITFTSDGVNAVFIATAPKIVVENGYRLIHYKGKTLSEFIRITPPGCMAEDVTQVQPISSFGSSFSPPKIEVPTETIDLLEKQTARYVPPSTSKKNFFEQPSNKAGVKTKTKKPKKQQLPVS